MKMALRTQQGFDNDDDEDLEALRLAALQTIKNKSFSPPQSAPTPCVVPVKTEIPTLPPVAHRPRNNYIRGGMHRGRHMRNGPFQRHRANPNLIAIVPIKEPSPPPCNSSEQVAGKMAKPSLVVNSASPKLVLPQDRYCKTEDASEEKQPEVQTKFDRFGHSSDEDSSSGDENNEDSEEAPAAEETTAEVMSDLEPDPDVLLVKDEDEDDSLEKLMNEMEEEIALDEKVVVSNKGSSPPPKRQPRPRSRSPPPRRPRSRSPPRRNPSPPPAAAAVPRRNPSPPPPPRRTRRPPLPSSSPVRMSKRGKSPAASSPTMLRRSRRSPPPSPSPPLRHPRRPLHEASSQRFNRSPSPLSSPLPPSSPPSSSPPLSHTEGVGGGDERSWSCTSSLSLSPSPERCGSGETGRRRNKSPLRLHGLPPRAPRSWAAYAPAPAADTAPDSGPGPRKRSRKERGNHRRPTPASPTVSDGRTPAWDPVLEARRRKFESVVPIDASSHRRIRLRRLDDGADELPPAPQRQLPPPAVDDLEWLLDAELENAVQLFSDDDSGSDAEEVRFKASEPSSLQSKSGKQPLSPLLVKQPFEQKIRVVPLAKLRGLEPEKEKKRPKPLSTDDRELPLRLPAREGSKKDSRNIHVQEQVNLDDKAPKDALSDTEPDHKKAKNNKTGLDHFDDPEDLEEGSKDGDLRAELSRRRAERLTMAGSVHESLPARLVQSAFKDAVGKKNLRRLDRERHGLCKRLEQQKGGEACDGRRVMVLKQSAVEQRIPLLNITFPKEEKHKRGGSPVSGGKIPIRMRLGLPGGSTGCGGGSGGIGSTGSGFLEERDRSAGLCGSSGGRRRGSRKVKLKRNVLLASPAGEKVMCGSSLIISHVRQHEAQSALLCPDLSVAHLRVNGLERWRG